MKSNRTFRKNASDSFVLFREKNLKIFSLYTMRMGGPLLLLRVEGVMIREFCVLHKSIFVTTLLTE